ncbi:MAG: flagellar export chaperone FliS [Deltaproteobacteria bacterium]|nr:flagellar export chaperone FliS [Deltaproteobacteria bacterium]
MNKMRQYHNVQVMTADKVRLIIMLCEGVIRFNRSAQRSIREGDIEGRNNFINRSLAIISELNSSLNMEEGGEIARNLSSLYEFSTSQLTLANLKNSAEPLEVVTNIISELKAGWECIAGKKAASAPEIEARSGYGA